MKVSDLIELLYKMDLDAPVAAFLFEGSSEEQVARFLPIRRVVAGEFIDPNNSASRVAGVGIVVGADVEPSLGSKEGGF